MESESPWGAGSGRAGAVVCHDRKENGMAALKILVLVVDDEQKLRTLLKQILINEHCEVWEAEGLASVRRAVETQHFDLVFLDLEIPGEDSVETLKVLKQHDPSMNVVIMTTGLALSDKLRDALSMSASDYIHKPFDASEIVTILQNLQQSK